MNDELSIQEACERLNTAASTIVVLCEKGTLMGAYQDENRQWHIPAAAIAAFVHQHATQQQHVSWWQRLRPYVTRKRLVAVLVALGTAVLMILRLLVGSGLFGR